MKLLLIILCLLFGFSNITFAQIFEEPKENALIMIHSPFCGFCKLFLSQSWNGEKYNKTEAGKEYPLAILDINEPENFEWYQKKVKGNLIQAIRGTPTFIFWKDVKEVDHLVGYSRWEQFIESIDIIRKEIK